MNRSVSEERLGRFKRVVWSYYRAHKRDMPWRRDTSPYAVIVSEIMLQQTQVIRVAAKFGPWMKRFPDWQALARAPVEDVLQEWSGLGYNRRALYVKRIAETVMAYPSRFTWLKHRFTEAKRIKKNTPLPPVKRSTKSGAFIDFPSSKRTGAYIGSPAETAGKTLGFAYN